MKPMIAILALGPRLFPGASQSNADAKESDEGGSKPAPKRMPKESADRQSGNATNSQFSLFRP